MNESVDSRQRRPWSFVTTHALVLIAIANDPAVRIREIADFAGVSERQASRVVSQLEAAGYVVRERTGRRNRYRLNLAHALPRHESRSLGELLEALAPLRR